MERAFPTGNRRYRSTLGYSRRSQANPPILSSHVPVRRWLRQHGRFHVHFTPTSASWLNMVERFFRDLTQQRLRRGVFHSVRELEITLRDYIEHHNQNPKPFVWTAKASDILEKVKRANAAMNKIASV